MRKSAPLAVAAAISPRFTAADPGSYMPSRSISVCVMDRARSKRKVNVKDISLRGIPALLPARLE
jgi:hypothetical protein